MKTLRRRNAFGVSGRRCSFGPLSRYSGGGLGRGRSLSHRSHHEVNAPTPALPRSTGRGSEEKEFTAHGNGRSLNSTGTRMMCESTGNSIVHLAGSPLGASSPPPPVL